MLHDFKLALRALRRRPGFTLAVVVTLTLGIGGSVAIFGVIDGVLLRPLPFPDAQRLVEVWETVERDQVSEERAFSYPDFLDLRAQATSFEGLAALDTGFGTLARPRGGTGESERVALEVVTASYFEVLGVAPALGTPLSAGIGDQVVLAHGLWQRRFGGDPGVIGRRLLLDGEPMTVVGVMPPRFAGAFGGAPELWIPLETAPARLLESRGARWHSVIGRLAPGVTVEAANREAATLFARIESEYASNSGYSAALGSLQQRVLGDFRRPLSLLFAAVALVLLVAAVNVANLMIVRATAQRRQTALLAAVGASPRQLMRRTLVESLLLGSIAGAGSVLLAAWALPLLVARSPVDLPAFVTVGLSGRVLGGALLLSVACALALGVGSWLTTDRHALVELMQGARGSVAQRRRARSGLLVFELALALVVAVAAGLLLRSWQNTRAIDPGYAREGRVLLRVDRPGLSADDAARASALRIVLAEQLRALPGVEAAALASDLPLDGNTSATVLSPEGRAFDDARPWGGATRVYRHRIGLDLLSVLDIPLLEGRAFDRSDEADPPSVAIVSRTLADRLWPGESAVGQRFKLGRPVDRGAAGDSDPPRWITVAGVVPDVRYRTLVPGAPLAPPPDPDVYFPLGADGAISVAAVLRTDLDPVQVARNLEHRLGAVDPLFAVFAATTFEELAAVQTARLRFSTLLMTLFAGLAIGLAAVGVHGVMAYLVGERTAEIGIRLAVGAQRAQVVRGVLSQGLRLVAAGLAIGTVVALITTRALESQLVDITANDPLVLLLAACLLIATSLAACWLPARRASRIDPLVALREE